MSTAANETRRNVMLMAWSFKRSEPGRTFADCLRGAWRFSKRMAETAAAFMRRARAAGGQVRFTRSLIRSPLARKLGPGSRADYAASYTTAVVGY
jgi:hypothetical protein